MAEAALYLSTAIGDSTKLSEILSAEGNNALSPQLTALGRVLQKQLEDDWKGAAETARAGRTVHPRYFPLANVEAFSHLAAGDAEAAWQALKFFPNLTIDKGVATGWLLAFIHPRRRDRTEAKAALSQYIDRPVDESRELNELFLHRLWDEQETGPETNRPCFH